MFGFLLKVMFAILVEFWVKKEKGHVEKIKDQKLWTYDMFSEDYEKLQ